MKNPDPTADRSTSAEAEGEDPQATQQIDLVDLDDADVSAEPVASELPPGVPPLPAIPPLPPMPPPPGGPASIAPAAPPAASRSPMFYVGVLVGVLVLSAAVGTVLALSRRRAAGATAAVPTASAAAAPKVITIGTIEMDDNPDSGP